MELKDGSKHFADYGTGAISQVFSIFYCLLSTIVCCSSLHTIITHCACIYYDKYNVSSMVHRLSLVIRRIYHCCLYCMFWKCCGTMRGFSPLKHVMSSQKYINCFVSKLLVNLTFSMYREFNTACCLCGEYRISMFFFVCLYLR